MKKWAFYLSLILLAACAKDESVIPTPPDTTTNETTSLAVTVNYADCTTGECVGVPIPNANVQLFSDDSNLSDDSALSTKKTSNSGSVLFNDLDQSSYVIVVECDYGGTTQTVKTPFGERTSVLIEFE